MLILLLGSALAVANLAITLTLLRKVDTMAATFAEVKATLEAVASGVDKLEAQIAELKAEVARGGVITQDQLDQLQKAAADIGSDINDTSDQG